MAIIYWNSHDHFQLRNSSTRCNSNSLLLLLLLQSRLTFCPYYRYWISKRMERELLQFIARITTEDLQWRTRTEMGIRIIRFYCPFNTWQETIIVIIIVMVKTTDKRRQLPKVAGVSRNCCNFCWSSSEAAEDKLKLSHRLSSPRWCCKMFYNNFQIKEQQNLATIR